MTATKPQLYTGEGSAIENYLNSPLTPEGGTEHKNYDAINWGAFSKKHPLYKTHQLIFSICIGHKWSKPNDKHGEVCDTYKLGLFLASKYSPVNKPLMELSKPELEKVIVALKGINRHQWNVKAQRR